MKRIASVITVFSLCGLLSGVLILAIKNRNLEKENLRLSKIEQEKIALNDSIENLQGKYILVDNVNPLVVTEINKDNGNLQKKVFLVIRNCQGVNAELTVGDLNDTTMSLRDISYSAKVDDSQNFDSFLIDKSFENDGIEGFVTLFFPKTGFVQFPFSEKKNKWW